MTVKAIGSFPQVARQSTPITVKDARMAVL